jgi:hyperosmotically inducible periplasmic protein
MKNYLALLSLSLVVALSVACASARKTGSTAKDATVAAGKEVGDKTEDAAQKTAEAGKKVADKTDDATTTSAIKMKFAADKTVDAFDINVDTKDGNVTLTGTVNTKAEADKAVALAKSVEGVKSVTPKLTIKKQ